MLVCLYNLTRQKEACRERSVIDGNDKMGFIGVNDVNSILCKLENNFGLYGFEFHPFKISWYNALVQPIFRLNCNEDTLAFLVISSPRMFENAFVPFLKAKENQLNGLNDPVDECMMYYLSQVSQIFPDYDVKVVHDFELHPNRRPKLVMQSIAHASGAAYFYHPNCVPHHNWPDRKMFGVCIHPKYGGWFALRAVVFFNDLYCPDLIQNPPKDVVASPEDRIKLLELYNFNWEDWRFRDIITVTEKYSEMQIKYFSTQPGNRNEVVKEILSTYCNGY